MFVKICGLRREVELEWAGWADANGFIVGMPKSRRNLTPNDAGGLMDQVPAGVMPVAVTMEQNAAALADILAALPQCSLQLHQPLFPPQIEQIRHHLRDAGIQPMEMWTLIQVPETGGLACGELVALKQLAEVTGNGRPDRVVLDTKVAGSLTGGSGKTQDWDSSRKLVKQGRKRGLPTLLAGGLTIANLQAAVAQVGPEGIDLSSGLEGHDGFKSQSLIGQLHDIVRPD